MPEPTPDPVTRTEFDTITTVCLRLSRMPEFRMFTMMLVARAAEKKDVGVLLDAILSLFAETLQRDASLPIERLGPRLT